MIGIGLVKVDISMSISSSSHPNLNAACKLGGLFLILGLLLSGCAGPHKPMPAIARIPEIKKPFFAGQILDLNAKCTISYPELVKRLSSSDIVFLGEIHDNPDHHLIQIQILQSLSEKWGKLTLAVEFLPSTKQLCLNRYMKGTTSEEQFLKEVNWARTWGFDYHFYRPLLDYQRMSGGPVVAINAPYELVKKVSRVGLRSLNPEERASLPQHIDLTDKAHRAFLRKIYGYHAHSSLTNFEYFYEAQCVWDETMAENVAKWFKKKGGKILVICGNGHILRGFGIPKRLRHRIKARVTTLLPYALKEPATLEPGIADFVWLTGKYLRIPKRYQGKLKSTRNQNAFDKKPQKN